MGELVYGHDEVPIHFDDRVLAHLQVVMIDKMRRGEKFPFTFLDSRHRERTLLFAPSTPVQFVFSGNRHPRLNQGWLHRLADRRGSVRVADRPGAA